MGGPGLYWKRNLNCWRVVWRNDTTIIHKILDSKTQGDKDRMSFLVFKGEVQGLEYEEADEFHILSAYVVAWSKLHASI